VNIRRQYSLPNCTLILEGLSDGSNPHDFRPPLTILVNAQCQFMGVNQRLEGGRAFLESLAKTVNRYAQECLSGVHYPLENESNDGDRLELVALADPSLHRLIWYPAPELHQAPVSIQLSTVQLFDLVEAVDQFIADSQTLPDFSVKLQPVPRRYRQPDEPLAQRAVPAAFGLLSLAIAGFAIYFLPLPNVRKPANKPVAPPTQTLPPGNTSPPPTATPTPVNPR
jgi:hypothetical protein